MLNYRWQMGRDNGVISVQNISKVSIRDPQLNVYQIQKMPGSQWGFKPVNFCIQKQSCYHFAQFYIVFFLVCSPEIRTNAISFCQLCFGFVSDIYLSTHLPLCRYTVQFMILFLNVLCLKWITSVGYGFCFAKLMLFVSYFFYSALQFIYLWTSPQ